MYHGGKTKVSRGALGKVRFASDEDRPPEPVRTYTLSQEEIQRRYGHIEGSRKRPAFADVRWKKRKRP